MTSECLRQAIYEKYIEQRNERRDQLWAKVVANKLTLEQACFEAEKAGLLTDPDISIVDTLADSYAQQCEFAQALNRK